MADTVENPGQHALSPVHQQLPHSDDDYLQPESPGMQKLQQLGTTQVADDESEVSAKLVRRPISSGSVGFREYTYGTAPKRDLHITKKHTPGLYCVPDDECHRRPSDAEPLKRDGMPMQADSRRSPPSRAPNDYSRHGMRSSGLANLKLCPAIKTKASHADDPESGVTKQGDISSPKIEPRGGRAPKPHPSPEIPKKSILGRSIDIAPLPKQRPSCGSIPSTSRAHTVQHDNYGHSREIASVDHENAGNASPSAVTNAEISAMQEQVGPSGENTELIDLTLQDSQDGRLDVRSGNTFDNHGLAHGRSLREKGNSSSSKPEWEPHGPIQQGRNIVPRAAPSPKTPLHPVKPLKAPEWLPDPQRLPPLVPSGASDGPTGRAPTEEDLYILLLHRYQKREHSEKQLVVRLRQLQAENTKLCQTAEECRQRLQSSLASNSRQTAEIQAQNLVISDIRDSNARIKSFMTDVYEDQEALKAEATSMNLERKTLREEHDHFRRNIQEAKNATTSSSNALDKIKKDLAEFRQETASLEMSLRDAKLELQNKQNLLSQERRRNTRYENYIAELTRKQNNFTLNIQQDQHHLLGILKGIRDKLSHLENEQAMATLPPKLPALEDCAEMLRGLSKVEVASPEDIADMIRVMQGLAESVGSFQKQSEESVQKSIVSRAQSDSSLMSQITDKFNMLACSLGNQDQIAELREAKITLEERVRGTENMLMEVRNGRTSAEKRENDLRAGNGKLVDELAKLRETALATKKGSGPLNELQSLSMKWTNTNSMLAESLQRLERKDEKLRSQEEQIRALSDQLGHANAEQQKSVEEIQALSQNLTESLDKAGQEKGHLLAEKDLQIANLRSKLKDSEDKCNNQLKDFENVNSSHHILAEKLEEANSRISQALQDCATVKSTNDRLNRQLDEMNDLREQAARVLSLVHECEVKDGTIANLQQEVGSLKAVDQQLHDYKLEAENKSMEVADLRTRLQIAEKASLQLLALQRELDNYKADMPPLKEAQEKMVSLESELSQKDNQLNQLNIKIAQSSEDQRQLTSLQMQVSRSRYDYECMVEKLKAAEGNARTPELERQIAAHQDEVNELRAKLAEAERISQAVPEMQAQMDQFSETINNLRRELEDAHQAREELHSARDANVTGHQTVEGHQDPAVVAGQASDRLLRLRHEMHQKDEKIVTLRMELARFDAASQQPKEAREQETEALMRDDSSRKNGRLVEDCPAHWENADNDEEPSAVEDKFASVDQEKMQHCSNQKRANRSVSIQQAYPLPASDVTLKPTVRTGSRFMALSENQGPADEDHAWNEQCPEEPNVILESQPRVDPHHELSSAESKLEKLVGDIISSSPLSDVGDLFDSSDQDQPAKSQHHAGQNHSDKTNNTAGREFGVKTKEVVIGEDDTLVSHSPESLGSAHHRVRTLENPSQESRPPLSSYGEPLLLDDLEGTGPLQASALDTANRTQSKSSTQDVLTSPVGAWPRKLSRVNTKARPSTPASSRLDVKAIDLIAYGQVLAKIPSPRRLRSSEPTEQTYGRQPLQDLGDDATNTRPATPSLALKEKHQPNSAIKRKCESAGITDEVFSAEKKRARGDMSNVEVAHGRMTGPRSTSSSTSAKVGYTLTRLRQSSSSTMSTRTTIVGKNAPAPGIGKQALKKPRGGSKSQRYNDRFGRQHS